MDDKTVQKTPYAQVRDDKLQIEEVDVYGARYRYIIEAANDAIGSDSALKACSYEMFDCLAAAPAPLWTYLRSKIGRHFGRKIKMSEYDISVKQARKRIKQEMDEDATTAPGTWSEFMRNLVRVFGSGWFSTSQISAAVRDGRLVLPFAVNAEKAGSMETSIGKTLAASIRKNPGGPIERMRDTHSGLTRFRVTVTMPEPETTEAPARVATVRDEWLTFTTQLRSVFGDGWFTAQQVIESGLSPLPSLLVGRPVDKIEYALRMRSGTFGIEQKPVTVGKMVAGVRADVPEDAVMFRVAPVPPVPPVPPAPQK